MMGPGKGNAPGDETARHAPTPPCPTVSGPTRKGAVRGRVRFTSLAPVHRRWSAPSAGPTPTPLPPSVRETLGDPAADDLARWLDENFDQRTVHPDEYRTVLSRLDLVLSRLDLIDERFERVDECSTLSNSASTRPTSGSTGWKGDSGRSTASRRAERSVQPAPRRAKPPAQRAHRRSE